MIKKKKDREALRPLDDSSLFRIFKDYFKALKKIKKYKGKENQEKIKKYSEKFLKLEEVIKSSLTNPVEMRENTGVMQLIQRWRLSFRDIKIFMFVLLQEINNSQKIDLLYEEDFDEENKRGVKIKEIKKLFSLSDEEIEDIFFSERSRLINKKLIELYPVNELTFIDKSDYIVSTSKAFKKSFTVKNREDEDYQLIAPESIRISLSDAGNLLEQDIIERINQFVETVKSVAMRQREDLKKDIHYPILLLHGERKREREVISEAIAKELGLPIIRIKGHKDFDDDDFFVSENYFLEESLRQAFDIARIHNGIIVINSENGEEISLINRIVSSTSITQHCPVIVLITGNLKTDTLGYDYIRLGYMDIKFEQPPLEVREKLWIHTLPLSRFRINDVVFGELAGEYEHFALEEIETTISRLETDSIILKREDIRHEDIIKVAEEVERLRLSKEKDEDDITSSDITLTTCSEDLSNVVLNEDEQREVNRVITAIKNRELIYNEILKNGFNYGRGVKTLFYGPPGTGKTLTVRAIAGELKIPVIEVMLSKLLNPYVGRTERAIAEYFREAKAKKAILFFDECDSIIMSRDMFSHSWEFSFINTFLKEVERFNGVLFLSTNYETIRDRALNRRIHFMIKFDIPGLEQRRRLVQLLGQHFLSNIDIERVIQIPFTGGDLKNVSLRLAIDSVAGSPITTERFIEEIKKEIDKRNTVNTPRAGF